MDMFQIDGPIRHVCIKIRNDQRMLKILMSTNVQEEFRHTNGEISNVRIETAGLGMRRARIANLPQKCPTEQYE